MPILSQINFYNKTHSAGNILTALCKDAVEAVARENGSLQRQRKFMIPEAICSLFTYCSNNSNSNKQTFTLNGFQQCYSDMFDVNMSSKALHNRLREDGLVEVMKHAIKSISELVKDDVNETGLKLLDVYSQSIGVKDIVMVDGSEVSLRYSAYKKTKNFIDTF